MSQMRRRLATTFGAYVSMGNAPITAVHETRHPVSQGSTSRIAPFSNQESVAPGYQARLLGNNAGQKPIDPEFSRPGSIH